MEKMVEQKTVQLQKLLEQRLKEEIKLCLFENKQKLGQKQHVMEICAKHISSEGFKVEQTGFLISNSYSWVWKMSVTIQQLK